MSQEWGRPRGHGRLRYGRADSHIGTGTARFSAMTDTKKCLHPACHCLAAAGSDYCSQYCEDAASQTEISCDCGHAGCALQVVAGPAPVEAADGKSTRLNSSHLGISY